MAKRFQTKASSQTLTALSIVLNHGTCDAEVDGICLKKRRLVEIIDCWQRISPMELIVLAKITKECLRWTEYGDERIFQHSDFMNYHCNINFDVIAKCLNTRGFYCKVYNSDIEDVLAVGWKQDKEQNTKQEGLKEESTEMKQEELKEELQEESEEESIEQSEKRFTLYEAQDIYDSQWDGHEFSNSEHSDDDGASDDHWSHQRYRRGCIFCAEYFEKDCIRHNCDHQKERDCNEDCNSSGESDENNGV